MTPMTATRPTALKNPSRTFAPNESRIHDIPPESFPSPAGPSPFTTPVAYDGHLFSSDAAMGPASATTEDGKNLAAPLQEGGRPMKNSMRTHAGTTPTIDDRVEALSPSAGKFVNRLIRQKDKGVVASAL